MKRCGLLRRVLAKKVCRTFPGFHAYSYLLIAPNGWILFGTAENGTTFKSLYIEEPRVVEEDVKIHGTVMVYIKQEHHDGTPIYPLPFSGHNYSFYFYLLTNVPAAGDVEGILVEYEVSTGATPPGFNFENF